MTGVNKSFVPETCVWELTLRCNMRCMHCGSNAGKRRAHELGVTECLTVADDLLKLGCKTVTFIGGELFLYPGWEKIARHLNANGVLVNVITNGWLMGNEQLEQIRYARLSVIGIDSVGNIKGCESLYDAHFIEGNVRNEPLEKIWFRDGGFAYNREFDTSLLQGRCAVCDKAEQCRGGCRGINYFSTGSPFQNTHCSRRLPSDRTVAVAEAPLSEGSILQ